jgi:flagellar motor switch protein FliM
VAQRPLARHCPELLARGPQPQDLLPALAWLGDRFAAALARALPALGAGEPERVRAGEPAQSTMTQLMTDAPALAANSLLAAAPAQTPVLATIDAEAIFRLLDRAFGGNGTAPEPLPEAFPLSAELFIAQLEKAVAAALGEAIENRPDVTCQRRHASLEALAPFTAQTELATLAVTVETETGDPWSLSLAVPLGALAALVGSDENPADPARSRSAPLTPAHAPVADIPLTLRAVIVDTAMPFSKVSTLAPGDILPVAVARTVPICVGETPVAAGSVGAVDDRVAIQISRAF